MHYFPGSMKVIKTSTPVTILCFLYAAAQVRTETRKLLYVLLAWKMKRHRMLTQLLRSSWLRDRAPALSFAHPTLLCGTCPVPPREPIQTPGGPSGR